MINLEKKMEAYRKDCEERYVWNGTVSKKVE